MNRFGIPNWMLTRKFAIGASIFVHVCVFAFIALDRGESTSKREVLIEFVPSEQLAIEPVEPAKPTELVGIATVVPDDQATRSIEAEPQPAAHRAAALEELLAIDLSAFRSNVVRTGLHADGPRIQAAGFIPLEPTLHLTEGEVDSLVTEGHGYTKQDRKRDVKKRQRGPSACFPPPHLPIGYNK